MIVKGVFLKPLLTTLPRPLHLPPQQQPPSPRPACPALFPLCLPPQPLLIALHRPLLLPTPIAPPCLSHPLTPALAPATAAPITPPCLSHPLTPALAPAAAAPIIPPCLSRPELEADAKAKGYGKLYATFGGGEEGLRACAAVEALCEVRSVVSMASFALIRGFSSFLLALYYFLLGCLKVGHQEGAEVGGREEDLRSCVAVEAPCEVRPLEGAARSTTQLASLLIVLAATVLPFLRCPWLRRLSSCYPLLRCSSRCFLIVLLLIIVPRDAVSCMDLYCCTVHHCVPYP